MTSIILNCDGQKIDNILFDYRSSKYAIGKEFETNQGCKVKIIGKCSSKTNYFYVQFQDKYKYVACVSSSNLKLGSVSNPFYKSVYNIGYIGVGKYGRTKTPKAYDCWFRIIRRCYDKRTHLQDYSYKNVFVHEDWHNLQTFGKWFDENYILDYEIDKDLLSPDGNKHYSANMCIFIPQKVNAFLTNNQNHGRDLPCGVSIDKTGKYISRINLFNKNKVKYIGAFETIDEARNSYIVERKKQIDIVKNYMLELGYNLDIIEKFNEKI